MSTQIETTTRQLPALPREVERTGYRILSALDRMGFVHQNKDGRVFTVRFSDAALFGTVAVFSVDMEKLWHFRAADLADAKVAQHLTCVLKKPVCVYTADGLMYLVRMTPAQPAKPLPHKAALDLSARPAGDLLVPIGKTHNGDVWRSLPELRHCLVVGTTGAGKSVWLHAALAALLTGAGPDRLRVRLIDPKRSELTPWAKAPHVLGDIAYTPGQALEALGEVVGEIDKRGDLFAEVGARDLAAYNRRAPFDSRSGCEPLPCVLVVVDETLDLVDQREVIAQLKTIAARGRSAGVYLWCATQHAAAVAGLPRVVNVNLTTRLVFRVADQSAALAAGCDGAQRIGRDMPGRMLAKLDAQPIEAQGYYLTDAALAEVVKGLQAGRSSGPSLSDLERELVKFAWAELGGAFTINRLAEQFRRGKGALTTLAATWERRGWLTPQVSRNDPRRVTRALLELAGLAPAAGR